MTDGEVRHGRREGRKEGEVGGRGNGRRSETGRGRRRGGRGGVVAKRKAEELGIGAMVWKELMGRDTLGSPERLGGGGGGGERRGY